MKKIDSCSFDRLTNNQQLVHIHFKSGNDFIGWIEKETTQNDICLDISGRHDQFLRAAVEKIVPLSSDEEILMLFSSDDSRIPYCGQKLNKYYTVALWAYKKNDESLAIQILSKAKEHKLSFETIRDDLGYMYFHEMLEKYSHSRDYATAAALGDHLSGEAFRGFEYQELAIKLSKQLKVRTSDFKDFALPNAAEWQNLKVKLNRKEQFAYLLDRIHLLNCIQREQPGGIRYGDEQTSISTDSIGNQGGIFWDNHKKYEVINPYIEICSMSPTATDAELLAPHLMDNQYIPTFGFHRDFKCDRHLYKYNEIIETILFNIANKHFADMQYFDTLDLESKNKIIAGILSWGKANTRRHFH